MNWFYHVVGWVFLLMCPFFGGGNLLVVMILEGQELISHQTGIICFIISSVAWMCLYVSWFDGSLVQKNLI